MIMKQYFYYFLRLLGTVAVAVIFSFATCLTTEAVFWITRILLPALLVSQANDFSNVSILLHWVGLDALGESPGTFMIRMIAIAVTFIFGLILLLLQLIAKGVVFIIKGNHLLCIVSAFIMFIAFLYIALGFFFTDFYCLRAFGTTDKVFFYYFLALLSSAFMLIVFGLTVYCCWDPNRMDQF